MLLINYYSTKPGPHSGLTSSHSCKSRSRMEVIWLVNKGQTIAAAACCTHAFEHLTVEIGLEGQGLKIAYLRYGERRKKKGLANKGPSAGPARECAPCPRLSCLLFDADVFNIHAKRVTASVSLHRFFSSARDLPRVRTEIDILTCDADGCVLIRGGTRGIDGGNKLLRHKQFQKQQARRHKAICSTLSCSWQDMIIAPAHQCCLRPAL